jgi:phospholipid N-methyltransferase
MLRRVLHSVTAVASRNFDHQHSDPTHLELILPGAVIERVYAMAAITTAELRKRALDIRFMVPGAGDIASFISSTTMAGGNYSSQLGQHYYLKLVDDNSFLLGCHKILGGRSIGDVPPELIQAMVDHIGPQLLAALHQSTGSVLHTTLEANSQRRGAKIDDHLRDEIAQLVVTTQGVELPAVRLHFYKHIKKLLEKAGGRYVQNRQYFEFDDGIDTTTLIDRLLNGEQINRQKETQFFATPRSEALELCRQAGPLRGLRVLEPSAGSGAIADVIMEQSPGELVTIENDHVNAIKLRAKGYAPIEQDFLQIKADDIGLFDAIIANPPFSNNRDIDHVMHMLTMLKPGGSLSVIMSMAWINGHQRQHLEFKQLLAAHQIEPVPIEAGTFSASGTKVATVRIEFNNFQPDLSPPPALAPARGKRLRI